MSTNEAVLIEEVVEYTDELKEAWDRLLPQLSKNAPPLTKAALTEIVNSQTTFLFVARDATAGDRIVGSITLAVFRCPSGVRSWIEDVVVDGDARGQGLGERLLSHAIQYANDLDARSIDLTSKPDRESANKLYQRVGFEERDTNTYRYAPPASV